QVGALVAIAGRFVVLDQIGCPAAWRGLADALAQGYALDALSAPEAAAPSLDDARDFLALLSRAPRAPLPTIGLGERSQLDFGGLIGTALEWSGQTVALTAFGSDKAPGGRDRALRPARADGRARSEV